ncbi:MAG: isoprenylcysteine carboxylmethyltransferase family protein [Bacteroidota bacterium]|nr:isoprenylcysteine carboxylmethyltransferase family protein [Bacteroidota bacterium]
MNTSHWILIGLWIVYYSLHSVFASTSAKVFFKKYLGKHFRYYRLCFTLFATITLVGLLYFQYSFYSPVLIKSLIIKYLSFIFLIIPGSIIMMISLKKYFMLLSGIRSIFTSVSTPELKIDGIHRFVRHPLYSGTMVFVAGLFFILPTLSNLIDVLLLIFYILVGIIFEEKKLKKEFGPGYLEYMSKVPKLIPSFRKQEK